MNLVGIVIAGLVFTLSVNITEASTVVNNPNFDGGKIVLSEESTVTITAWLGTAYCRVGQVSLVEPSLKLVKSSTSNEASKNTKLVVKNQQKTIIYDYASGTPSVEIGPYPAGTEIVLSIQTGSFCKSSRVSTDKFYTRVKHNGGGNSWTIAWEDYKDMDLDDVFTEVTINPIRGVIGRQAFSDNPVYKLPYPSGTSHKFTVIPGVGEHKGARAYDIDMRIGDKVVASEMGLVLWIEDSFGAGSCNSNLRSSVNVVVIQTEPGINLTYVHLAKGSVQLAGIKVGDVVKQGQWIGNGGNSGFVCSNTGTGSHLHIEWQHNCYDLDQAKKRRALKKSKPGESTLSWACPGFPADSPYSFMLKEKALVIKRTPSEQTSDNSVSD